MSRKKPKFTDADILAAWEIHDDGEISTEQLMQRVCDTVGKGCEIDDVTEALWRESKAKATP